MLQRIVYTLKMLWRYRIALVDANQTAIDCQTEQLSPQQFQHQGVTELVLDFDGVLSAHGDLQPLPAIESWLNQCVNVFGASHIFILSNKPMSQRIDYFAQHYAGIRFITGVQKKPYPDGLQAVIELTQQPPQTVILLDDRLLTGVLATYIAGTQHAYITQPYRNFKQHPVKEAFFQLLRYTERFFVRTILARQPINN